MEVRQMLEGWGRNRLPCTVYPDGLSQQVELKVHTYRENLTSFEYLGCMVANGKSSRTCGRKIIEVGYLDGAFPHTFSFSFMEFFPSFYLPA